MPKVDARYWDLAELAADRLVGPLATRSLAAGIVAQWIAEHGWGYPPNRNNPGNLAHGWTKFFAFPCHAGPKKDNPQPGNPIMTFDRLEDGALCYVDGLRAFKRYRDAVAKAAAGDGLGFAVAVCEAGYGTNKHTVRSVYKLLLPSGGGQDSVARRMNVAIRYCRVITTRDMVQLKKNQPLFESPGGRQVTKMTVDAAVPRLGLAGTVDGKGWCAVVVGTSWSYVDKKSRPTGLYVPVANATLVPG